MKTFTQLLKEFIWPFLLACLWCFYNYYQSIKWDLASLIQLFGASFFFLSWLLAQYFRVSKQVKLHSSISLIEDTVVKVTEDLKIATNHLINYQTGGDSFCYLFITRPDKGSNFGLETIFHQGDFPLYDIQARIVDLGEFDNETSTTYESLCKNIKNYGNLTNGHCISLGKYDLGNSEKRLNIFWSAKNGSYVQLLRYKKIDDKWHYAISVIRDEKIIFEKIDELYPRNLKGEIEW